MTKVVNAAEAARDAQLQRMGRDMLHAMHQWRVSGGRTTAASGRAVPGTITTAGILQNQIMVRLEFNESRLRGLV